MGYITGTRKKRKKNKVAIVGFAPSTMAEVRFLFGNPEFEIWGLNQLYMAFGPGQNLPAIAEHADRWFQIHHRTSYDANIVRDHSHHDWLANETRFPIYMQEKYPEIPMSVQFPKEKIMEEFGSYFTNSISWEIALAIMEGFEEIHLYGVDMATHSEYAYERPSVEYFLGWAKGRGIKIIVPEKSDLLKSLWLYPYEDSAPFRTKCTARKTELSERARMLNFQEQAAHDQRIQVIGKLEFMNELEAQFRQEPPESMEIMFANFEKNRMAWREFVNKSSLEEQALRDNRMQVLGAADNIGYVEQTWENSARELSAQKTFIEGLQDDISA
jgi:hypothetical protein